jgi:hypothetical protein
LTVKFNYGTGTSGDHKVCVVNKSFVFKCRFVFFFFWCIFFVVFFFFVFCCSLLKTLIRHLL